MRSWEALKSLDLSSARVLLYGASGWIGGMCRDLLEASGAGVTAARARMEEREAVLTELRAVEPTHVVCAAGVTGRPNVDWCETHQRETIRANVTGTLNLADLCADEGVHLTIFATGCIYEYDAEHTIGGSPFTEDERPNFDGSFYSLTKGMVDRMLMSYPALVLRVRMPISDNLAPRCFVTKIRKYEKIVNVKNSVTVLHDLLPAGLLLAARGKTGTYNFTNPGAISHNECMELYRDNVDSSATWENFSLEEQDKVLAAKRSNNELSSDKLTSALPDVEILDATSAVREAMQRAGSRYSPDRILVTGGAGFIGSHVVDKLVREYPDAKITVVDKMSYCSDEAYVNPAAELVRGDIRSSDLLRELFRTGSYDTVLHFAAETHVDNSFGNSIAFTESNVLGTHVLLECIREAGTVKRMIHVSTDEVYGESTTDVSFGEGSVLLPTNPYSATKASAEMLVHAYRRSFDLPIIVTRGNNVYGPRQYPEKVIPRFVKLSLQGLPHEVQGDGSAIRSFLYVEDVADAFCTILARGRVAETYNIGTDFELTVNQVSDEVSRILGVESARRTVADRPFNDRRYSVATGKLEELGWRPRVPFKEGLSRTVAWYR